MLSIKYVIAAATLGAALLAAPATVNAKVLHKASTLHKTHAKKLVHRTHKHVALHVTHAKHKALTHKTLTHKSTKAKSLKSTSTWKHHPGL